MRYILLEPATQTIMSTTLTKAYLRVNDNVSDTVIELMENTAISIIENWTGLATGPQQWRLDVESSEGAIEIPIAPLYSIDEVKEFTSFESTGTLLTVSTDYRVSGQDVISSSGYWPKLRDKDSYQIKFTSGVWDADDIRINNLKTAALRLVAWMYENREEFVTSQEENFTINTDMSKMPLGLKTLLNSLGGQNVGL